MRFDRGPANGRNRVRRETGKELMVRVHYDEGVAIHIGPESCAVAREGLGETFGVYDLDKHRRAQKLGSM